MIERLRVLGWSWNYNPRFRYNMRCEPVELTSAADFLINIVVPNLHPRANILEVLSPTAEGAKALENERQRDQQRANATAQLAGNPPGRAHVDGARVHILYEENGQQYEELIMATVHCGENPAGYSCQTGGGETVVRAPAGYLSALMANSSFAKFAMDVQDNPDWQSRLAYDQQQTFLRILNQQNRNTQILQEASNAAFRQMMQNSDILFQGMMANSRAFNERQNAQFQQQQRNPIEIQQNMNWQAHRTVLYALDQKEYINPSNGQIVTANNKFSQVWGSSDSSLLVGTTGMVNPNSYTAPGAPVLTPLKPRE